MNRLLRNGLFVGALVAVVTLTTSVPGLVRERASQDAVARREHVDQDAKEKLRKLRGD